MSHKQVVGSDGAVASLSTSALKAPTIGPPPGVATRLAELRALYVPETVAEAKARLARERPANREPFEAAVARRLLELRSLLHLADYLHRASPR